MTGPGYSGTPLAKKLGIKPGTRILPLEAPREFREWLGDLPDDVAFTTRMAEDVGIVHVFAVRSAKLAHHLQMLRQALRQDGAVWVSWPKKTSKVPTDITEDVIRALALPLGFVDIKVRGHGRVVRTETRYSQDQPDVKQECPMSEGEVTTRCPKCQGFMVQGFVVDHTHGGQTVSAWVEGAPVKSFWMGIKVSGRAFPIGAFRCDRCAYLEFYARHRYAAQ